MPDNSLAERYHRATKYSPESIAEGHEIDWANPPAQFKTYPGARSFPMRPYLPIRQETDQTEPPPLSLTEGPHALPNLARLLYFTNGVTAIGMAQGSEFCFRAAPSAGALYPTDLYLAVRDHPDLPDGILNFHVRRHELVEVYPEGLGPDGEELFARLRDACLDHPALENASLALIATAVFGRSSWRYGDRAYRRCLLDTGHVLGNFDLMAPRHGFWTAAIGGFRDEKINDLLAVPKEREGALAVFPLQPLADFDAELTVPAALASPRNSAEADGNSRILGLHKGSTILTAAEPPPENEADFQLNPKYEFAEGRKLTPRDAKDEQWEEVILKRRSTRTLSGAAIDWDDLSDLLTFAYRPDIGTGAASVPRYFDTGLLETFLVINDVETSIPGVYYFAPGFMEILKVKHGDFRREIHQLSLGQDLAHDSSCVLIHTADLNAAVERYGDRAYRYLHMDAGHIGQRLNLEAIRLGLGVSGIGGFFDDEVNRLLDIPEREACIYITCLGKPA